MALAAAAVVLSAAVVAAPTFAQCRVGVEVRTTSDKARTYGGDARPVRVVVWYPARTAPARPMTRGALAAADWVSPAQAIPGWNDARDGRRTFAAGLRDMRSPVAPVVAYATPGCAGWLLPAREGRWPLVLIGSGLGSNAVFHSRLAETLADAGLVVAVVGVLGPSPGTSPGFDADTVRLLRDDAALAVRELAHDPRVDTSRLALVGWSISGVVHLALARQVDAVRAIVSLDSGVGYNYGPPLWAAVHSTPLAPRRYLHLKAGVPSSVATDDTLLRQLGADIDVVPGLAHAQFTDLPWGSPATDRAQDAVRQRVRDFLLTHVAQ